MKLEGEGRCNSGWNRRQLGDEEKKKTKEICQWGGEVKKLRKRCFGLGRGTNERSLEIHSGFFFGRKVDEERED